MGKQLTEWKEIYPKSSRYSSLRDAMIHIFRSDQNRVIRSGDAETIYQIEDRVCEGSKWNEVERG